jgi:hypothetical protein
MADDRVFGGIASRIIMENDRVRIWEMRLAPGEKSDLHRHDCDYVMIQVAGDKMAAHFEPDSGGEWPGIDYIEGEVAPGNVIWAKRGGIETAVNIGSQEFYEIVVELKD